MCLNSSVTDSIRVGTSYASVWINAPFPRSVTSSCEGIACLGERIRRAFPTAVGSTGAGVREGSIQAMPPYTFSTGTSLARIC